MFNLRERIEAGLEHTLEGRFGLPVKLLSPDGEKQVYKKGTTDQTLQGQVIYDTMQDNPNTGAEVIVHMPVISVRKSSLDRVPLPGERWAFEAPVDPSPTAATQWWLAERPREDGGAIGFIRLYGIKMIQEP
jgi:hypothetical protein